MSFAGPKSEPERSAAFTLIEIMIVCAIMAIVMTMGVPFVYRAFHREALIQAILDVEEVCSNARAQAILHGSMTEVIFHPKEGRLEVAGTAAVRANPNLEATPASAGAPARQGAGVSAQFSDRIKVQMLEVNLAPYTEADLARVRFYPNGTCDELNLVLLDDKGEQRGIELEVTTGLANVVNDIREWLGQRR